MTNENPSLAYLHNMNQDNRLEWVDNAKGLCMLLVVWVHMLSSIGDPPFWYSSKEYIQAMYMPCFFILSGFFTKDTDQRTFIRKRCGSLLKPFIFTYLVSYAIGWIISTIKPDLLKNGMDFLAPLYSHSFVNGPIWFLLALFTALIIVQSVNKTKLWGGGNCNDYFHHRVLLE